MKNNPNLVSKTGNSLRESFGTAITEEGFRNSKILLLDGDVAGGTGGHHFRDALQNQFVQCGIAEQNMVGVAAGLAKEGFIPVVSTFAAFLLRAADQIRLSVSYSEANVKLVGSHVGLDVGPDGASAQCLEDLAFFRSLPNFTVLAPATPDQMHEAVTSMLEIQGPVYLRTGRSPQVNIPTIREKFELGRAQTIRGGWDLTLASTGSMLATSVRVAEILETRGIDARVLNFPTVKPLDGARLRLAALETGCIATIEDHNIVGGFGAAVCESVSESYPVRVIRLGVPDAAGQSGQPDDLYRLFAIDPESVAERLEHELSTT